MKRRPFALLAALGFIALPALVVLTAAARYRVAQRDDETVMIMGERSYSIHVPSGYDHSKPTPLVLTFHGAGLWGTAQRALDTWADVADREGFIAVYPSGRMGNGPRVWMVTAPMPGQFDEAMLPRDVYFVAKLIDRLQLQYNIDARRIYANGLSNGGGMTWLLSCYLGDRIAAFGMVGAAYTAPTSWCASRPPAAAIMIHGTADSMTKYHGGKVWIAPRPFPDIPGIAREWAGRNGCSAEVTDSQVAVDVSRRAWRGCSKDLVFYTIDGGGHTWPGGRRLPEWFVGKTTRNIDASATMWEFFKQHPLAEPTRPGRKAR